MGRRREERKGRMREAKIRTKEIEETDRGSEERKGGRGRDKKEGVLEKGKYRDGMGENTRREGGTEEGGDRNRGS